jgi:type I restriction enzyme M protein
MLGAIIGDIVGSVYEWNNVKTKEFELFQDYGFYTDDTVMTLAVATALKKWHCSAQNGDIEQLKQVLIDSMHVFGHTYPDSGYGSRFKIWLKRRERLPYNSFGNGSAMRVSPVAYVANSLEEVKALARATAEVTHNHPEGIKGAESVAVAIFLARQKMPIEKIKEYICENYYKIDFTLEDVRPTYKFDVSCQGSVPHALQAFFESTNFEDAIRNAISIGGDSDTIACITGSIAEAYYGIPDDMIIKLKEYLDPLAISVINNFAKIFLGWKDNKLV